ARCGATLRVIGEAPAGTPFPGRTGEMQAVRILTGGVVPAGADAVVIQEEATAEGERVAVPAEKRGKHVRPAGQDFRAGATPRPGNHPAMSMNVAGPDTLGFTLCTE
ncbi:MAG: hypothetical protein ACREDE_10370, partial [Thermoplasmata archaeon]